MKQLHKSAQAGFTLLEVLVATAVLGVAVIGLLTNLESSLRNTSRVTQLKNATLLAQHKMDELLAVPSLPNYESRSGEFQSGIRWQFHTAPFELPPNPEPGARILQLIQLQLSWHNGEREHTYSLDGYRQATLSPSDLLRLRSGAGIGP